jgi:hypothetical protein
VRLLLIWITERLGLFREIRCPNCGARLSRVPLGTVITVTYHCGCNLGQSPFAPKN